MISTKLVEEKKEFVSPYIKPGITVAKIAHIEHVELEQGSNHLKVYMESEPKEALNGEPQKADFSMYVTPKAIPYTMSQIADIAEAAGTSKEEMDKIEAPDWDAYVEAVRPIIVGKFLRFKFKGEEIFNPKNNSTWLKAKLPTYSFVESVEGESKLKYDPAKDITSLPKPDAEDMQATTESVDSDMPF